MGVFWLLTWPGIFKGDEFYVIRAALSFTMSGAQSGITSLFYMVSLLFFPSMASITFIQILLICTIFSVIMHDLFSVLSGKKRYLLFLPFILLPVIDGNLFTLRATLVGWIFLFVLAKVYYLTKTDRFSGKWLLVLPAPRIFTSEKNTSEAGSLYACVITCILYALQYTKQNCIKWKQ